MENSVFWEKIVFLGKIKPRIQEKPCNRELKMRRGNPIRIHAASWDYNAHPWAGQYG
jgi:hypothetical protein